MYQHEIALIMAGKGREAIASLTSKYALYHNDPSFHVNLSLAYEEVGDLQKAESGFRHVIHRYPHNVEAISNLVNLLAKTDRIAEAASWAKHGVIMTGGEDLYCRRAYGMVSIEQLEIEKAIAIFREVAMKTLAPQDFSRYLGYSIHTGTDYLWHADFVKRFGSTKRAPQSDWTPARRMRIAFLGNTFRDHARSSMLLPVMEKIDFSKIETFVFCDNKHDAVTGDFQNIPLVQFQDTGQMSDEELAQGIVDLGIDVVIDTIGHQEGSRLGVLLQKPASVMLTYVGYAADTVIAENIDQQVGWAFKPNKDAPPVSELPKSKNGHMTFGSIHRAAKINRRVMEAWAGVLKSCPTAVLRIMVAGGEANVGARSQLEASGVPSDRFLLIPRAKSHLDYLRFAESIDVHLDSFPYCGGATTCDLLWQGVPTIAMAGGPCSMAMRLSSDMLQHNFSCQSPEWYIKIAQELDAAGSLYLENHRYRSRKKMDHILDGISVARRLRNLCVERVVERQKNKPQECCNDA